MAISYVNRLKQDKDYHEALMDRISELVISNYNLINPNISISDIQKSMQEGKPTSGRTDDDSVVIYQKDVTANSTDENTFGEVLNHFLKNNEVGAVDVSLIDMVINNGVISLTHPQLAPLVIGVDTLENLFINDNVSQFLNVNLTKNKYDIDKTIEFLETQISEFKPTMTGDILQQRITKLFKDFIAIKKNIRKGATIQDGTKLKFVDKSAVTLNYLIKQCLNQMYDSECVFTEDQYKTLYDSYKSLEADYHSTITSSKAEADGNEVTIESKRIVIDEMIDTVFVNVLNSFNLDEYWITKFKEALRSYIAAANILFTRNDRNLVTKNAWKFKPLSSRNEGDPLYGYGWNVVQEPLSVTDEIAQVSTLDSAEEIKYQERPRIGGVLSGGIIQGNVTFQENHFQTNHLAWPVAQGGAITFNPPHFYYVNPRGRRFYIRTNKGVMSTMANTPFVSTEWSNNYVFINGLNALEVFQESQNQMNVWTNYNNQGTVSEAYLMFVGSDKSRFESNGVIAVDGDFSKDFMIVYRGGGDPIYVPSSPDEDESMGNAFFSNPGKKYEWYWDNGLGFHIDRKFVPNKDDAIVAKLFRNTENSDGITAIVFDGYTEFQNQVHYDQEGNPIDSYFSTPFTVSQYHWGSHMIPPEFTFQGTPSFNGEQSTEYKSLLLCHEPGNPLNITENDGGDLKWQKGNFNLYHTSFAPAEKYSISLYVKVESSSPIYCQPYFSVYNKDDLNLRSSHHLVGENKSVTPDNGWIRLEWEGINPPDVEEAEDKTVSINFRFTCDSGGADSEEGSTQTININNNPIISVSALQVEVGEVCTPWREPGEIMYYDGDYGEASSIYEDEETDINVDDDLYADMNQTEFTSHESLILNNLIEPVGQPGDFSHIYKSAFSSIDVNQEPSFEAGDILKISDEYILVVENNPYGYTDMIKVKRGWFDSPIINHDPEVEPHTINGLPNAAIEQFKFSTWSGDTEPNFSYTEELSLLKGISDDIGGLDNKFVVNRSEFFHPKHRIVEGSWFIIDNEKFYVYKQGMNTFEDRIYIKRAFNDFNDTEKSYHAAGTIVYVDNSFTDLS